MLIPGGFYSKMKKLFFIITIFTVLFTLSGCKLKTEGESLSSFTERLNTLHNYGATDSGYIYNEKENSLTKFFSMEEGNVLLSFSCDNKNNLKSMNIVVDALKENNTYTLRFILHCIKAFINDDKIFNELNNVVNIEKTIKKLNAKTVKSEIGGTELLIDTTEIGVVITINKK